MGGGKQVRFVEGLEWEVLNPSRLGVVGLRRVTIVEKMVIWVLNVQLGRREEDRGATVTPTMYMLMRFYKERRGVQKERKCNLCWGFLYKELWDESFKCGAKLSYAKNLWENLSKNNNWTSTRLRHKKFIRDVYHLFLFETEKKPLKYDPSKQSIRYLPKGLNYSRIYLYKFQYK